MTLPGLSGSFILILLGNYVLLLVDSVNALYDSMIDILSGNFNAVVEPFRLKMIKVLAVFTLGSVTGLVSFSHILNFVLKRYKAITISMLMGFIVGSLGVVWPWKKTIYKLSESGDLLFDGNSKKIVENYERFLPELNLETFVAAFFIIVGICLVLFLEWYGHKTRKK